MKAIVDCNSFYCSCERLFRPELEQKPVVVLSNNDGCIISRSDEAKAFGIGMAGPYFKAKPLIEKHGVATFSSNYNLYGDLSWRVMETLRVMFGKENVEVYSVDECFVDLDFIPVEQLQQVAINIKETVEMWTGIKVSVGIAPTKVLAKAANRLSKKNKQETNCVMVLDTKIKIEQALRQTHIDAVWGIGYQYAEKLKKFGVHTAFDLTLKPIDFARVHLGGVIGQRLWRELKGMKSMELDDELLTKKMIMTTRMFGEPVDDLKSILEAVATYVSRAAEKLRRQNGAAKHISVFIVAKEQDHLASFNRGATISSYTTLQEATSQTHELIKPALEIAQRLFEKGRSYKKAGVMLSHIVPDTSIALTLLASKTVGAVLPWIPFKNPLSPTDLSRDPEWQAATAKDPLYNRTLTPRWFTEANKAQAEALTTGPSLTLPLLMVLAANDGVASVPANKRFFETIGSKDKTLRVFDGMLHEPLNEIGKEQVWKEISSWISKHR